MPADSAAARTSIVTDCWHLAGHAPDSGKAEAEPALSCCDSVFRPWHDPHTCKGATTEGQPRQAGVRIGLTACG